MRKISIIIILVTLLAVLLFNACVTEQASFTADYIREHRNTVSYELPEVFELANIAAAITDYGIEHEFRINKEGEYYKQVIGHFEEYRDHSLIQNLNFSDDNIWDYYSFRNQSYLYSFQEGELVKSNTHLSIPGSDVFSENLDLIENFASVSGFRHFFASHREYYQQQISEYRNKLPVRDMWSWLEAEFPMSYHHYIIVFSPLIGASHNTVRYKDNGFRECIIFVSGPDLYEYAASEERLSEEMETALLSHLVFTEIDHNYVNKVSARYQNTIDRALTPLDYWNEQTSYRTPQLTFNEYVTWGLFNLFAADTFSPEVYERSEQHVIISMENRGFIRFKQFNDFLKELYGEKGEKRRISSLFPQMIDWFNIHNLG